MTCAKSAAKSASATLPERMSERGRQVSNIVGVVMYAGFGYLGVLLSRLAVANALRIRPPLRRSR